MHIYSVHPTDFSETSWPILFTPPPSPLGMQPTSGDRAAYYGVGWVAIGQFAGGSGIERGVQAAPGEAWCVCV